MLEAGASERRRIWTAGNDAPNRRAVERSELGLDQRYQRGVGVMHETTGSVHVLTGMMEPKPGRVALDTVKRAAADDLDRPHFFNRDRQQQIGGGSLSYVARQPPFFADIAWQQIDLRPADDADVLRILRRCRFAEAQARDMAVGLAESKYETGRIEAIFCESMRAVFTRRKHAPRCGVCQQPKGSVDVVGHCRPSWGAVGEPSLPRVATKQILLPAVRKFGKRDPLGRDRKDAARLQAGARGVDRPAASDCDDADQDGHRAGGQNAETVRECAAHRRRHQTTTPNAMTLNGSKTSTNKKVICICRCVSRISGRL